MSPTGLQHFVVTLHYQEESLGDIQQLTSAMIRSGFTTSLHDEHGKSHELGLNSFGIITAKTAEELQQEIIAASASLPADKLRVDVQTLDDFLQHAP